MIIKILRIVHLSCKTYTNYYDKEEFKDSSSFDYVNEILEYKNL